MTEQTWTAGRNQGATKGNSAASAAGARAADKPERERKADALPLSEGAVPSGAHDDKSGQSPADATDTSHDLTQPLDSRKTFGGGNVRHEMSSETPPKIDHARQARLNGAAAGDDGYDPSAARSD